jgi:hypothetical protein
MLPPLDERVIRREALASHDNDLLAVVLAREVLGYHGTVSLVFRLKTGGCNYIEQGAGRRAERLGRCHNPARAERYDRGVRLTR